MTIEKLVEKILNYALKAQFFKGADKIYMRNKLCAFLEIEVPKAVGAPIKNEQSIGQILSQITKWAYQEGRIQSKMAPYSELFETALMDILVPKPSDVEQIFWMHFNKDVKSALDWYYNFSKQTDYIKVDNVAKNVVWQQTSNYGKMMMTINLSKPEKDPKAIEVALKSKQSGYPKCLLCKENVGFAGNLNHPARQTHRIINIKLADEDWFMQYSPYVYYNEHTIIIKAEHTPMLVNGTTFLRLCDFLDLFPHYFIGSNAGLPVVGGSMLAHDHYQGGNYKMPIEDAASFVHYGETIFKEVDVTWLNWPLTVLRLKSTSKENIIKAATEINNFWKDYSDEASGLIAYTNEPHHAVTPIARKKKDVYELDIVLRDNRRSKVYPDGIYHPHPEIHPVKKENIGLIEVMGYAILPGRLKETMDIFSRGLRVHSSFDLLNKNATISAFKDIYQLMQDRYAKGDISATEVVKTVVGDIFITGLRHAGVITTDENGRSAMTKFIEVLKRRG